MPSPVLGCERGQLSEKARSLVRVKAKSAGQRTHPGPDLPPERPVKIGISPIDEGERRIRKKLTNRVRLALDERAVAFLASAQRRRRGQPGVMATIQARRIPKQGVCQQRDGGERDEPDLKVRPVEPGLLSRSEQPSEQDRTRYGNRAAACGPKWHPACRAGEQGHPAGIRSQRQRAQEEDDKTDRRVQRDRSEEGHGLQVPAPIMT